MMRDMLLSQQYFCAGTLLTLVFSMLLGNRRSPRGGALFCASMALLSAVVLQILKTYYEGAEFDIQIPAISAMCAGLTVLCAAALLTAFFLEYRKNGLFLWKEFLLVCTPPWLYGLVSVLSQNAFQFTEALTLSLLLALFLYQRDAEAEIKRRAEEIKRIQMTLFQEQMRPHFIFNSLTSIRNLCLSDPSTASKGLDSFAGYLRKNMDALSTSDMIPFTKELEHIRQYVALEMLNQTQQFEMVYDLSVKNFYVPALSIQPLVENAIRYGVRSRSSGAIVILTTERQGEAIRVIVEDNGMGFPETMTAEQNEHKAHGLDNVRFRLESQGGSLHLNSDENGVRAVVLIPTGGKKSDYADG